MDFLHVWHFAPVYAVLGLALLVYWRFERHRINLSGEPKKKLAHGFNDVTVGLPAMLLFASAVGMVVLEFISSEQWAFTLAMVPAVATFLYGLAWTWGSAFGRRPQEV
jgi:hypothetical protein